jgi:hypothetical protein
MLTITVQADSSAFQGVAIIGTQRLGETPVLTAPPYRFSLQIPADIASGDYSLTAIGFPKSGAAVSTPPDNYATSEITVDIERADQPRQLRAEFSSLSFDYPGESIQMRIIGVFADGAQVDLTHSRHIAYSSAAPAVATVDAEGFVMAVGAGAGSIVVTYSGNSLRVPVTVPPAVTIIPSKTSLYTSKTEEFTARVTLKPGGDQSVTWSIHPALGSIDSAGVYTAPSAIPSWRGVTVTATSVADPTKSASAQVWVFPPVSISITPSSVILARGQFQDFIASVENAGPDVKWTVTPEGVGTFTPGRSMDRTTFKRIAVGTYTAPTSIASRQILTITAMSVSDNSKKVSTRVVLVPFTGPLKPE